MQAIAHVCENSWPTSEPNALIDLTCTRYGYILITHRYSTADALSGREAYLYRP